MPAQFALAHRNLAASLLKLAWPVALARLGIMGMGLVDVIVVGQLAPASLPHQALGWAPTGVMLVTGIGLLTGVQVLAARAIGAGNPQDAGGAWRRGMIVSLIAGAIAAALMWLGGARIFTIFGITPDLAEPSADVMRILALSVPLHLCYCATAFFLEAIQRPMASMIVMWGANAINLALNLMLVPEYGAVGSAWATFGARIVLAGGLAIWVLSLRDGAKFGVRSRPSGPSFRALLAIGAAAAVSQAAEAGAFSAMTILAGRISGEAVAAYQILLNLLALVFMIALGLSTATAVLTSEAIGRKAPAEAARASWMGLLLNTGFMLLAALLVLVAAPVIGRVYTADLSLAAFIASLMWLAAAIMPPDGGQVVTAAALRARGDNWFPTASHIFAYAFVMPALAFWLAEMQGMGVAGLMLAIFWSSVVSVGVLLARLWALRNVIPNAAIEPSIAH
ncbi:MAG: MATE family efflux transporter [Hyphomonadaceae bacterium]